MYLIEQFPMVCLGCLENKYFPRHLIFPVSWFSTKPSGTSMRYTVQYRDIVVSWYCGIGGISCVERKKCTCRRNNSLFFNKIFIFKIVIVVVVVIVLVPPVVIVVVDPLQHFVTLGQDGE